jgi:hypothetical protein
VLAPKGLSNVAAPGPPPTNRRALGCKASEILRMTIVRHPEDWHM